MRKIHKPTFGSRRTVPLSERWGSGWAQLCKEALELGFEPWVPKHSRLFSDWGKKDFALGPRSWTDDLSEEGLAESYVYVSPSLVVTKESLLKVLGVVSFLVLDAKHPLAPELKQESSSSSLVIVNCADAFVDYLALETWKPLWASKDLVSCDAQISNSAILEPGVMVGPFAVIEDGVVLKTGTRIGAHAKIGAGSVVGPYAVIEDYSVVGQSCAIGPHSVIGTPGFGILFYPNSKAPRQRVHVGSVTIGDRVRMGAYVSVDRGVFENTVVGSDTQIDNHVQIAHNCRLGEGNILCGFVVLGGSTDVGSHSTFAGLVGTKGHVSVGSKVVIGAQSGVSGDIPDGQQVKGYPPRPMAEALKIATLTTKLPDIYQRLKSLEKEVQKLSGEQ